MPAHDHAIANEFDSYMQDRAKRLGYGVRFLSPGDACALPGSARLALVEFKSALADGRVIDVAMRAYHDRGHFVAWAEGEGALVQMNVYRKEVGNTGGGAASRIGVRTFAEEFFGNEQARSLSLAEFKAYLERLAAGGSPAILALVARLPDERHLALVRLPSVEAARQWLRTNAA